MSLTSFIIAADVRPDRERVQRPVAVSLLWRFIWQTWQQPSDEAVARAILELGHSGVAEDFLAARRGRGL